jgi:hypothetical protein
MDTTLTLALEGDVTLAQFANAVDHFHKLLRNLTEEVAADHDIQWDLEDLHYGSAMITVVGHSDEPGNYREARGILAQNGETEPAEVSIRHLRDAQN